MLDPPSIGRSEPVAIELVAMTSLQPVLYTTIICFTEAFMQNPDRADCGLLDIKNNIINYETSNPASMSYMQIKSFSEPFGWRCEGWL